MTYKPNYLVAINSAEKKLFVGFADQVKSAIKENEMAYKKIKFSNQKYMAEYVTREEFLDNQKYLVSASLVTFRNITRSSKCEIEFLSGFKREVPRKKLPSSPHKILCYACRGWGRIWDSEVEKRLNYSVHYQGKKCRKCNGEGERWKQGYIPGLGYSYNQKQKDYRDHDELIQFLNNLDKERN